MVLVLGVGEGFSPKPTPQGANFLEAPVKAGRKPITRTPVVSNPHVLCKLGWGKTPVTPGMSISEAA